ncbi:CPBP family intramembrane glutamic endopeptidase [Bacillus sp. THAF10]|uniref:CPBP family intramembrane glutamic endopeptidase n=1 Tax=Bacillus sp. THAF10 TaxID=2587848 RepID=UPI001C12CB37|nr:type II CAAX endopeptidase family protein [Bacillus sp. THAF10]
MQFVLIFWILACTMISWSFLSPDYFWILFPLSLFVLACFSIYKEHKKALFTLSKSTFVIALLSGIGIYLFFLLTYLFIKQVPYPIIVYVTDLYNLVGPKEWWHYVLLVFVIIPGEELFWRGFIQKQLKELGPLRSVLIAAALYSLAHAWTGNPMLMAAAFTGGSAWGFLFLRTGSLSVVIISHLVFDLLLLVLVPLTF